MTIKEIAAKAGVSIATVSHVINHTRYVSPERDPSRYTVQPLQPERHAST